ncbi:glycoside hydrolase family 130 protein [Sphingobacterium bovistauri]|uniref:Glycoside hydrolase family 130 protein n=1 Tax=Sphingobacterium bovistauri TaxID=2781959 RepID=A0ABS7ZC48_9SPHI|nr:glycoside hydrolase family 130 protein [Sphingobacterium bovistauri]MCA5006299.1 glycoside hydrolase family 130 protein [Sphingobacterium bovistauri]
MTLTVNRKQIYFMPDSTRVLARYFNLSDDRKEKIIKRVIATSKIEKEQNLNQLLRNFSNRHRSVVEIWEKNFKRSLESGISDELKGYTYSYKEKLIIGACFTMEYSVEAAAFFNPSIVLSPDQTQLDDGQKRVILSFRATGEGHVSSIVFRSGIIDNDLDIKLDEVGKLLEKPKHFKNHIYNKSEFFEKLSNIEINDPIYSDLVKKKFPETFTYEELRRFVKELRDEYSSTHEIDQLLNQVLWLASSHYSISYSLDTSISERVIFPISETEKNGIEDARFLKFELESGSYIYYATYTAYDGISIMPKLLSTKDFISFKVQPINGKIANKGAALFPKKINGKYVMLCRIDGENNYISFSDDLINWHDDVILLREPHYSWEYIQLGNCGAPIETEKGWLVLTHGVGPMRQYTLSASLLDLNNPSKIIGRLNHPLLYPNEEEREGYVPNVVYSCGQLVHNGHLIIPYAMSDYASTYATINLNQLLNELLQNADCM